MTSDVLGLAGRKVLFATVSGDRHIYPLTGLAKYLQDAGCDVRWYASKYYTTKFQQLSIYHYPLQRATDFNCYNIDEVFPERARISGTFDKINYDLINVLTLPAIRHVEDIQDIRQTFPFDIMIVDNMFTAAPIVREILKVPVVAVGVVPLTASSVDLPPYGMGIPPSTGTAGRIRQAILRFLSNRVLLKKASRVYEEIFEKYGISYKVVNILDSIVKHTDLVLQIGTPGLEYHRSDIGSNIRFIGALHPYTGIKRDQPWSDARLHQYKKAVLITQSITEKDFSKLIIPALQAFRNTDILTIVTTGGRNTERLRNRYACDNVIIEDHIPFDDVMPYMDAFITDGCYGDILQSLQHQLPVIAAGVNEGRNEICARIGYLKYGLDLHTETPTADLLRRAYEHILRNDIYKRNIIRLNEEFRQYDPIPLSAGYVAELLKKQSA